MSNVLVFDVNETLLDLRALDPHFERIFGSATVRELWFNQMLHSAFVATITDAYQPFGEIGLAALEMLATKYKLALTDKDKFAVREGMTRLPPHEDVLPALRRLKEAGFRLGALTNSTQAVVEAQLTHAGIRHWFEAVFSADTVRRLKPAPEPYHYTAREMRVPIQHMRMIAAHGWDIAGALRAGCAGAFVARPGKVLDPLAPTPDINEATLAEVTYKILERA